VAQTIDTKPAEQATSPEVTATSGDDVAPAEATMVVASSDEDVKRAEVAEAPSEAAKPEQETEARGDEGTVQETNQRTLALIKPDAYSAGHTEAIKASILEAGFRIVREKEIQFSLAQAQEFYAEHQGRPFFDDLTTWMSR
jgi:hypothetical protein